MHVFVPLALLLASLSLEPRVTGVVPGGEAGIWHQQGYSTQGCSNKRRRSRGGQNLPEATESSLRSGFHAFRGGHGWFWNSACEELVGSRRWGFLPRPHFPLLSSCSGAGLDSESLQRVMGGVASPTGPGTDKTHTPVDPCPELMRLDAPGADVVQLPWCPRAWRLGDAQ